MFRISNIGYKKYDRGYIIEDKEYLGNVDQDTGYRIQNIKYGYINYNPFYFLETPTVFHRRLPDFQ